MSEFYYKIAVNFPLLKSVLTYKSELDFNAGDLVQVPLGRRKEFGCILSKVNQSDITDIDTNKIKSFSEFCNTEIRLSSLEIKLYEWLANYYQYSLGQLIFDVLPNFLKRPRKFDYIIGKDEKLPYHLNQNQSEIFKNINQRIFSGFSKNYIHGITGSGKTSIYLELMKQVLSNNKSVIFLLPEINLTPQFTQVFENYLNVPIFSFHSGLSNSDKYNLYTHLQTDTRPKLILGVRSSVFLPVKELGLIIVDEEHDNSFKQDDRCPYHARDVAIKRCQIENIPIILGSATPSLENYYQFNQNLPGHFYYTLKERAGAGELPQIGLIDERKDFAKESNSLLRPTWPLCEDSVEEIKSALSKNEQVLVFVNRLGYANFLQCRACGHQFYCPNCSVTLKYFKKRAELNCQHCDFKIPLPNSCPKCSCLTLEQRGFGTERVEETLNKLFPNKFIDRFDRDEIKTLDQLEDKLNRFHTHQIDILVGTQMLSKGHNFKKVNLVLILGIDNQLNFPDFRSNEKVYQLLTQVSGRSGRYGNEGRVLIQTLNPENPLFEFVKNHDFDGFYKSELSIRESCYCPPFSKIILLYFTGKDTLAVQESALSAQKVLMGLKNSGFEEIQIYPARPANIEKKSNQFTWCIMIKSNLPKKLHDLIFNFHAHFDKSSPISLKIDIDPQVLG
jgi:primosomal protein N' (replication factor Y)